MIKWHRISWKKICRKYRQINCQTCSLILDNMLCHDERKVSLITLLITIVEEKCYLSKYGLKVAVSQPLIPLGFIDYAILIERARRILTMSFLSLFHRPAPLNSSTSTIEFFCELGRLIRLHHSTTFRTPLRSTNCAHVLLFRSGPPIY
ncbi:hypothetical protein IEQ34_020876 [Dendrobium chrysotoxum]|uniref:Uncharacterized protein n=1 Tax=Dendrobium chrysotoxum TaxID=161865 RepID=A0AAV7G3I6_DENCH|nr:hypothetical protein IEQ34_020876 [Dendrobium chrysotoxum]